jgi:hypothetical protein
MYSPGRAAYPCGGWDRLDAVTGGAAVLVTNFGDETLGQQPAEQILQFGIGDGARVGEFLERQAAGDRHQQER